MIIENKQYVNEVHPNLREQGCFYIAGCTFYELATGNDLSYDEINEMYSDLLSRRIVGLKGFINDHYRFASGLNPSWTFHGFKKPALNHKELAIERLSQGKPIIIATVHPYIDGWHAMVGRKLEGDRILVWDSGFSELSKRQTDYIDVNTGICYNGDGQENGRDWYSFFWYGEAV